MSDVSFSPDPSLQDPPPTFWSEAKGWVRDIVGTFVPALLIVLVFNVFIAQATRVEGQSMEPNLHDNQRLIIEKVTYRFRSVQRDDIVVLKLPNRPGPPLIKRVVGMPGEEIAIHDGQVFIDGDLLTEPYLNQLTYSNHDLKVVPDDHVFVMGDNRGYSSDSRSFGVVHLDYIVGRAWFCYWPVSDIGFIR